MEKNEINLTQREFKEERFEFALYVNDNLICKRNFKINNYINGSMQSYDFKEYVDYIVWMIKKDLESKSRVYTWYYFDENCPSPEFTEPLIGPWECTFKFEITDNKHPVITKIWDGYGYPKSVRDKVDIANKSVKITKSNGQIYTYDKETFFENNKDRLSPELYVLRAQIMDKPDLLSTITKTICLACSPRDNMYQKTSDYRHKLEFGQGKNKRVYKLYSPHKDPNKD